MRILLTNDDGINAPGLSVLEDIAKELSDDIWIAAPEEEQSGKGRAISLTQPVRTRKVGAKAWAIAGTPSDCVQLGIPSIALSQAQSFRERGSLPWETARAWGAKTLRPLIKQGWPSDVVINVNFPDREPDEVAGIQITRQGFRDESIIHTDRREDLRGNDYYWIGYKGKLSKPDAGTDLRAIYDGYVSVSPLHVDLTHEAYLKELRETWPT